MSCIARHTKNVLCFECYKSRLDVPPTRRLATVTLFPRVISDPALAHRREMLTHLTATAARAGREAASHLRTSAPPHLRTSAPPHLRTFAPSHLRTFAPP